MTGMQRRTQWVSWGLVMVATPLLMAFDPVDGDEPLPKTVEQAERDVRETVHYWTDEYPDRVSCKLIHEEGQDLFECWIFKAGHEPVLSFTNKG
jgi:hypothetical protein